MSFGLDELYGFGYQKTLGYSDRIAAITANDLSRFVADYLDPSRCTIAVTKPAAFDVSERFATAG